MLCIFTIRKLLFYSSEALWTNLWYALGNTMYHSYTVTKILVNLSFNFPKKLSRSCTTYKNVVFSLVLELTVAGVRLSWLLVHKRLSCFLYLDISFGESIFRDSIRFSIFSSYCRTLKSCRTLKRRHS